MDAIPLIRNFLVKDIETTGITIDIPSSSSSLSSYATSISCKVKVALPSDCEKFTCSTCKFSFALQYHIYQKYFNNSGPAKCNYCYIESREAAATKTK